MAKKAAKKTTAKAAAKPAALKPIKDALSKSGLVAHLAETTGVVAKDVRAVLGALEGAVAGSVHKKGHGSFTLPGLLKITAVNVPPKPKRKYTRRKAASKLDADHRVPAATDGSGRPLSLGGIPG